ncbi:Gfo/Idh/MocA family protein [Tautonia sociabilis]|uniref:Gfo/Idh/MocA family oxidoreductase n=1 Tax=Tautonia sociabilis TaxID=2080755 RepID=A0A432MGF1_9BACT|nr:Gfo/Idh/MocA family oxidoreductase [Tautonia sociabilis]RUL85744.1 Gfo/Idh/MocA family oxidoreductase [Tautonia sociabilis]
MPTTPDSPPRPLRWGILGCARITRRGLAPGILASQWGTVFAMASRDVATARSWAEEFGAVKAYGDYRALLDDPEVDAVYIPLPNELHRPWVLAAADAGKHVLCEKPLALDAVEAAAMVEHGRSRGVLLMEAFMWRHQPRTAALLTLVREGGLGRLRLIRSSFSFPIEPGDWRLDPRRGGGALWDVGCYGVNTCRLFAGAEPVAVRALRHPHPSGVDLTLTAELAFPGGLIGLVDCSFEAPFRCEYELVGTSGSIRVPDAYLPPALPTALRFAAGSDAEGAGPEALSFDGANQYARMIDAFACSVAAGTLVPPAEDGLAQMQVLDRVKAAALDVAD